MIGRANSSYEYFHEAGDGVPMVVGHRGALAADAQRDSRVARPRDADARTHVGMDFVG